MRLKNIITISILVFLLNAPVLRSQTIVGTNPENKNVIIEEFTGRNCIYCPNGHALAAQLEENNPGDVFVIARHAGSFSPSDYPNLNLPESEEIRAHYDASSYPSGAINRINYQGEYVLGLDKWVGATNSILSQASYVNVGVEASINPSDRVLSVHTELYYTADANSYNEISVVLVQNGIIGFQIGIGPYYEFNHNPIQHLTGIWGEEVENTSSGAFIDKTYSVELPEYFNDIEIDLNNLGIVVYVAEQNHTIISGSGCEVEMNAQYDNDPALTNIFIPDQYCNNVISPTIEISNTGNETINSVDIIYSVNEGNSQSHTWNGTLEFLEKTTVDLPEISFQISENNIVDVELLNDDNDLNNQMQKPFNFSLDIEGAFEIEYKTIFDSEENYWEIINCDGEVVQSGSGYDNLSVYNIPINIETPGCYDFVFYDTEGNGFSSPSAYLKIFKDNNLLFELYEDFGSESVWPFASDYILNIDNDLIEEVEIELYPNPASTFLNIQSNYPIEEILVLNSLGQIVYEVDRVNDSDITIDLSSFSSGIYLLSVKQNEKTKTKQIMIK